MNAAAKIEKLMEGKGSINISHQPHVFKDGCVQLKYRVTVYNDQSEILEIFETLDRRALREYLIDNNHI